MNTPTSTSSARPHSSSRVQRPSSSLSQRPQSSLSSARPVSSASLRPHSRISTRPNSRLSRPATRQSTRLLPLCQSLVTQVTALSPDIDDENFRTAVDFVSKNLEYSIKAGASTDMTAMDKHFRGYHVLKASINSHDGLADALQESYHKVKQQAKELTDLDERIKLSHLPDHLQLLILCPTIEPPAPITWKEILAAEPFEGQHWEGVYGLPAGSTVEGWETRSDGSTPSLSPWDEDDSLDSDTSPSLEDLSPPVIGTPGESNSQYRVHRQQSHFELIERLKTQQYWREDWKIDVDVSRPFDIGDPSTLGPAMLRVLGESATLALVGPEREVRAKHLSETFCRLWGMSEESDDLHYSGYIFLGAFSDSTASTALYVNSPVVDPRRFRTDDNYSGCGDPLTVSLLSLEKEVRDTFSGTFDVVLDILHRLVGYICQSPSRLDQAVWNMPNMPTQLPSAVVSALLLDLLLQAAEEQWSMGNVSASNSLATVFAKTAESIWRMIGKWLKDGMPVRNVWDFLDDIRALDEEFFIEDNELPLMDPDLWADGYVLRSPVVLEDGERKQSAVPAFLGPVVDHVLGAGKAVGLLRMMGIHFFSENVAEEEHPLLDWNTFAQLFESKCNEFERFEVVVTFDIGGALSVLSRCWPATITGDVISNFTDVILAKMDSQQAWNDFHFLNSAFRDVLESTKSDWIDASLIRLSYRGTKAATISNTVKAIDGLLVEYALPFPLTYIFTPSVLQNYCSLFVFLLQVIHVQVLKFKSAFKKAKSLDEIIKLHDDQCTSSLSKAILSILDMCIHFRTFFTTFAGDTTHDISRLSISMRRHRSRRQRRQRKDVIGFSAPLLTDIEDDSDTDTDVDMDADLTGRREAFEPSFSVASSYAEGDFSTRLEKLSEELDGLVRYVRRGVENLARGTSDAASAFGVLAFTLEDWDS
ncbi:hypothetical protein J3R83DRAFT_1313 [Lanmaoa asiatica]|nr:hypothetical protein J3R83DRAFT_1313 [Lanmaoa asiatica]